MKLGDLVGADDIVFGIRANDIAGAAEAILAATLTRRGFAPGQVRRLLDAVVAREREMSTSCGASAIPHARDAMLESFIVAVGINPDGVIAGQRDPRVIFAFLSPDSKRQEHLALLALLSRLSRDNSAINAIAAAKSGGDVVALLQR